ncbi:DDE Tnp 4 domain containing protein [Asbolus verrucosus]|uniref:DDE Tnp 4 domain containing protein n=1 Tax=Asbolus verrucosus TaxID=1661398 RepID=A0A482W237_ASBVE|nr:DDE Tnp 4 domain containing protein [Asbolus verrucosus]
MEIPDEKLVKLFRLDKYLRVNVSEETQKFLDYENKTNKIPVFTRFLAALNFNGSGSFETSVSQELNIVLSQPVVSRCLNKISAIFTNHLLARYVKFPVTEEHIHSVKQGFQVKLQFPHVIGAIDCKCVAIFTPEGTDISNPALSYLNRKGYYCINGQAICDSEMIFANISSRYPGATYDIAIWQTSTVNNHLQTRYLNGERRIWLIWVSGYPIQPWMMTAVPDALEDTPKGIYTTF